MPTKGMLCICALYRSACKRIKQTHTTTNSWKRVHKKDLAEQEARWHTNDERWETNDERWATNDERWETNDERWQSVEDRLNLMAE